MANLGRHSRCAIFKLAEKSESRPKPSSSNSAKAVKSQPRAQNPRQKSSRHSRCATIKLTAKICPNPKTSRAENRPSQKSSQAKIQSGQNPVRPKSSQAKIQPEPGKGVKTHKSHHKTQLDCLVVLSRFSANTFLPKPSKLMKKARKSKWNT
jgi:hypothetical protein